MYLQGQNSASHWFTNWKSHQGNFFCKYMYMDIDVLNRPKYHYYWIWMALKVQSTFVIFKGFKSCRLDDDKLHEIMEFILWYFYLHIHVLVNTNLDCQASYISLVYRSAACNSIYELSYETDTWNKPLVTVLCPLQYWAIKH